MAYLFWISMAVLLYCYAGYPLQLWLQVRIAPRPIEKHPITPEVVMIVVAHNESHRIEDKIKTCLAQHYPADQLRVLVVSDGSTDHTADIVRRHPDPRVSLLEFTARRGKAACLNDAVAHTSPAVIVFTDARQRLHPDAVARLVANLADPNIGAVSGELVFEQEDGSPFSEGLGAYWRYEKFIRHHEAQSGSVVGVTGALYAIRRVCFQPIPPETILDDVAIPMLAALHGWRISFENGAIAYDTPSRDAAREKLRKVRTLAGNFQLISLLDGLLSPTRNPLWGRFIAHKMLRLICPLALSLALAAHTILAWQQEGVYRWTWFLHTSAYLAVLAAMQWPKLQRHAVLRLGVTFAHLNLFVVLGLISFLRGRQSHLWVASTATAPSPPASTSPKQHETHHHH